MDVPIQLAVRIKPEKIEEDEEKSIRSIESPVMNVGHPGGVIQLDGQIFPVTYAISEQVNQEELYLKTVCPLIGLILEGYDFSVVAYGQKNSGKTYTLYGSPDNFNGNGYDPIEEGLLQRCAREIFHQLSILSPRNYAINIEWMEISGEVVRDLLDSGGSVPCYNINDIFHWISVGLTNKNKLRTPLNSDSHTLFTLTLEQQWISKEGMIQHRLATLSFTDLCGTERTHTENIPKDLGLQSLEKVVNQLTAADRPSAIDYSQTTLTTLLKDAFGGRAQTLMILCASAKQENVKETMSNMQFVFKVQCVRNCLMMNTFSDNNTPFIPPVQPQQPPVHALQFAASQWFKLVSNAEGLFAKLMSTNGVTDGEKKQIKEWLFLKQECEDCFSSQDMNQTQPQRGLSTIKEEESSVNKETDDTEMSDPEASMLQNSDLENESDTESPEFPEMEENIETLMENLRLKTDNTVNDKYKEFQNQTPEEEVEKPTADNRVDSNGNNCGGSSSGGGGRRRSIQPGTSLSSDELALLNEVAKHTKTHDIALRDDTSPIPTKSRVEAIKKKLYKINDEIKHKQHQIMKLDETIALKKELIADLVNSEDTRSTVKKRFHKKKPKLEGEYQKAKRKLAKVIVGGKDKSEIERLNKIITALEQRLQILNSIKHLTESDQKLKELKHSLSDSEKQQENCLRSLAELKKLYEDTSREYKKEIELRVKYEKEKAAEYKTLKRVKSIEEKYADENEEQRSTRYEIQKLRKYRDYLIEQKCCFDQKHKSDKMLSEKEKKKMRECNEGIESIDAVIEYKNEMICGRKSIDLTVSTKKEKGSQILMEVLGNLSNEEMRMLLYKYFVKIIDFKDASHFLESQMKHVEREKEELDQKVRFFRNTLQQERLEYDRKILAIQQQHENKMNLMLQHFAVDTSSISGNSSVDQTRYSVNNSDLELYNNFQQQHQQQQQRQRNLGLSRPKEKNTSGKRFSNLNMKLLTRYQCSSSSTPNDNERPILPLDNLRQLMPPPATVPTAKVTRQRNKIIIQDSSRN